MGRTKETISDRFQTDFRPISDRFQPSIPMKNYFKFIATPIPTPNTDELQVHAISNGREWKTIESNIEDNRANESDRDE